MGSAKRRKSFVRQASQSSALSACKIILSQTNPLMLRLDHHKPEIVKPSLGAVGAVADDEMVATQGLVAHVELRSSVVSRAHGVAKHDMVLPVADAHNAIAKIVMEIHMDSLAPIACLDVRMAHVAIGKRAFDVDFVLVVDERVMVILLHARRN